MLKLVLVRHADAGDRDIFAKTGRPDDERPLSGRGVEQLEAGLRGFRALITQCDLLVTSPYVRARQTADILAQLWNMPVTLSRSLEPERPPTDFISEIRKLRGKSVIVGVGHEPHLGLLATWLISGINTGAMEFSKGGACLITFDAAPRSGQGRLRWFMGPKQLARITESAVG